jgi:hypothetical protein
MAGLLSSPPRILRATARHRVGVAYAVAPDRLASRLPDGLVPDTRAGRAYVVLVGVRLAKVRVLGLVGPGFRRVPAVELQILVRRADGASGHGGGAGTFTVQAFVPRRGVAWGARWLYDEPVDVASMQPVARERAETVEATYRFDRAGREQRLRVVGWTPPEPPAEDALVGFLRNRPWRYATRDGRLFRSRLERPEGPGPVYPVQERHVTVQWKTAFGPDWAFLADAEPAAALFAPGRPIALRWRERVE